MHYAAKVFVNDTLTNFTKLTVTISVSN